MREKFRFYKAVSGRWYIDLPGWAGSIDDLEMVQGADTMLDRVSDYTEECILEISDVAFEGANVIRLVTDLSDSVGGGDYIMESYKGEAIEYNMWLCSVTVQVFGILPAKIYISFPL